MTAVDRQLIAQLAIAVGVCIGGWLLLVEPTRRELAQLRAQIHDLESAGREFDPSAIKARASAISQLVNAVKARNVISADSAVLYGTIMTLARQTGVTVQNVRPGSDQRANASPAAIEVHRLEIVVDGTYDRLAEFLAAIGEMDGYLRPSGLSITPVLQDEQRLVAARLAFEAVEFKIPEPLLAMTQGAHNDQP